MSSGEGRLAGKVCIVTGASRGIGKGIALQLAQAGAIVYITGRTLKKGPGDKGSLEDTAKEAESRGGRCIPVQCDHTQDADIKRLFDRVASEQDGRLDVLVNNAYSAVTAIMQYMKVPFWEQPVSMWDDVNNVGLRNHYICSVYAAKMMTQRKQGLIVNVSSAGGLTYLFNVAYGVGKEACDRMAADCAIELRRHNVTFVSLWPGAVKTELITEVMQKDGVDQLTKRVFTDGAESIEYAGRAVVNLAADPNVRKKSGRVLMTADLGDEYGFKDVDGSMPGNMRCVQRLMGYYGWRMAAYVPLWVKIPRWMMSFGGHKL